MLSTKTCREVEIVQRNHDSAALLTRQAPDQRKRLESMADVEMVSGSVQQDHRRLLGDHHGEPSPLLLSARQGANRAVGEMPVSVADSSNRERSLRRCASRLRRSP